MRRGIFIDIELYGYTEFFKKQQVSDNGLIPARVTAVHKELYEVVSEFGEKDAKLKGSEFYNINKDAVYPCVGDFVYIKYNPIGEDIIYNVMERKSKFSRRGVFNKVHSEQLVAANFDYVFILVSLNNDFNVSRVERYLAAAWQSGGMPVIILTKTDLCDDYTNQKEILEAVAPGVPVVGISSVTMDGINLLSPFVAPGNTIVFLGSSGVGKSSLLNAISGETVMKVKDIREDDSKGRHTTTYRQLTLLNNGALIIDTPGMRELGMWEADDGVERVFSGIEEMILLCRYRNCAHNNEEGCAVQTALKNGELTIKQWENYLKLKKEAKHERGKEDKKARFQEAAKKKAINRQNTKALRTKISYNE